MEYEQTYTIWGLGCQEVVVERRVVGAHNGQLVRTLPGATRHYVPMISALSRQAAVRVGENAIAVHCHQTTGGQYINVGLAEAIETKAAK